MRRGRGRRRSDHDISFGATGMSAEDEIQGVDDNGGPWRIVEYRAGERRRRGRGGDPYNSATSARTREPWRRLERR